MNFVPNTFGVFPSFGDNDTVIVDFGFQRNIGRRDVRTYQGDTLDDLALLNWDPNDAYPVLAWAVLPGDADSWLDELYDNVNFDSDLRYVQLRNRETNNTVTLHRRDVRSATEGLRWFRCKNSYADLEAVEARYPSSKYYLADFAISSHAD